MTEVSKVCEQAAQWEEFDAATLERYYTTALDFSLGEAQLAGIAGQFIMSINATPFVRETFAAFDVQEISTTWTLSTGTTGAGQRVALHAGGVRGQVQRVAAGRGRGLGHLTHVVLLRDVGVLLTTLYPAGTRTLRE